MIDKKKLTQVEDAKKIILNHINQTHSEEIHIMESFGRILDKSIFAKLNNPPVDVSSMDGYGVTEYDKINNTKNLKCIGISQTGKKENFKITNGETVRVFTGAEIPKGAKSVVIQENTAKTSKDYIKINHYNQNSYIRKKGMDFKKGEELFTKGYKLNAISIALIASAGISWVLAKQKPKIAILSNGDELIRPGDFFEDFKDNKIVSSNSLFLYFFIKQCGGDPIILPIAADNIKSIGNSLKNNTTFDLIISSGGASVGKYDLIKKYLMAGKNNFILDLWKIAMRPGKPLFFGRYNKIPFLGLPGNPVSTGVCSIIFLKPIIEKFLNESIKLDYDFIESDTDIEKNDEREEYLRSIVIIKNNKKYVKPFIKQDSSQLNVFSNSNCFIFREPNAPFLPKGKKVKVIKIPYL